MKSSRAVVMIFLALVAGVAAVLFAARWVAAQASMATRQVVVAARDIDAGTPLNASMLQTASWPSAAVPNGAATEMKAVDARVLRVPVLRGEPVLEGKLAPVGAKGGLSALIAEGKRAITVKVNEVIGVAGFALPGNYVDVLVNVHDERDKPVSKIVLERILVLAVAQEAVREETKPKVVSAVTLEVSPAEAERLDLARSVGSLSLVLRNQMDSRPATTAGVRKDDLLELPRLAPTPSAPAQLARAAAPKRAEDPRPARDRVEVIRGMQKSAVDL